jgi:two-component sensor histidine kinase
MTNQQFQSEILMSDTISDEAPTSFVIPDPAFNAAEADHRIANNLSIIAAYLRLQAVEAAAHKASIPSSTVQSMLREAAARVETIGRLHRRLAEAPRRGAVDLSGYLQDLCDDLARSMTMNGRLTFKGEPGTTCMIAPDRIVPLALTVLEAVTNAIKYAHPAGVAGRIEVSCVQDEDGALRVEVADDGVGLPEDFNPARDGGLGLKVMRSLVHQLGGVLEFDSADLGLRVAVTVPATD